MVRTSSRASKWKVSTRTSARYSAGTRWEEHVQFSLALSAYAADNPQRGELSKQTESLLAILTNSFRSLPPEQKLKKEATFAGNVKEFTLENVSVDEYVFGVKAIDRDGNESLVAVYGDGSFLRWEIEIY